jgi:N-acetylneuraminic acid mutarotase
MLYCFDTTSNEWHCPTTFGAIPAARDGHSSCIFGDAMFIFGGYEDSIEPFRPDVYKLDLITWEWTLLKCKGEPPIYRDFHTATVIGDKMFIFGGRSDTTGHNEHHHFLGGFGTEFYSDKLNYLVIKILLKYF